MASEAPASPSKPAVATAVVGGVGHILRGAFSDLYEGGSSATLDAAAGGAGAGSGTAADGYESDEAKEVRNLIFAKSVCTVACAKVWPTSALMSCSCPPLRTPTPPFLICLKHTH